MSFTDPLLMMNSKPLSPLKRVQRIVAIRVRVMKNFHTSLNSVYSPVLLDNMLHSLTHFIKATQNQAFSDKMQRLADRQLRSPAI
ncbi:hypothetical protein PR048_000299 [Dryococelus australis]|uniref:Uncharacterized protein n=1 Tax=Dryococelus australis TaxID=614101 RepID=A0ABQ9IEE9_9NEOP|nr:hypothetical protein PR048_000299 [Dryococelus australis]